MNDDKMNYGKDDLIPEVAEVVDALDEVLEAYKATHNVRWHFDVVGRGVTLRMEVRHRLDSFPTR